MALHPMAQAGKGYGCSNRRKAVGNNADPVIGSSIEIDLIGQLIF